jgi:hypothetical protein
VPDHTSETAMTRDQLKGVVSPWQGSVAEGTAREFASGGWTAKIVGRRKSIALNVG